MTVFEKHAMEVVKKLISNFTKLEFDADIGDTSYRVTFFVWIDGKRRQCYQLADDGVIDEQKMDSLFASYVDFVRKSKDYKKGEVNIIHFVN